MFNRLFGKKPKPDPEQIAGENLRKEFPDVRVVKLWFTCNDDLVCSVCQELDGKEVEIDQFFAEGIFSPPAHEGCRCWMSSSTALAEL